MREYPTYHIPPCAKKGASRQYDEYSIHKRKGVLQLFLDSIAAHRELRSSPYLNAFLKISDDGHWNKAKTELEKKHTRISVRFHNYSYRD